MFWEIKLHFSQEAKTLFGIPERSSPIYLSYCFSKLTNIPKTIEVTPDDGICSLFQEVIGMERNRCAGVSGMYLNGVKVVTQTHMHRDDIPCSTACFVVAVHSGVPSAALKSIHGLVLLS